MRCIDPANATLLAGNERSPLDESNAGELVPWFHELQMDNYLSRCDDILAVLVNEGRLSNENELDDLEYCADLYKAIMDTSVCR